MVKRSANINVCMILLGIGIGCAKPEETLNRRRFAPSEDASVLEDSENNELAETAFSSLELVASKNFDQLDDNFLANLQLINKPSSEQIILFGKDGNSWTYNPGDEAPPSPIAPVVVVPEDTILYSLPNGEFWTVNPYEIGKRKSGAVTGEPGAVVIERFGTESFSGNKDKISTLFVSPSEIVLHLDTHIIILTTEGGKPSFNQFAVASLPVELDGPIVAAGRAADKGFWLASKENIALLTPSGSGFTWSKIKIPMNGLQDYKYLGMWINQGKNAVYGDVLMLVGDKFFSRSGAPIAAASGT